MSIQGSALGPLVGSKGWKTRTLRRVRYLIYGQMSIFWYLICDAGRSLFFLSFFLFSLQHPFFFFQWGGRDGSSHRTPPIRGPWHVDLLITFFCCVPDCKLENLSFYINAYKSIIYTKVRKNVRIVLGEGNSPKPPISTPVRGTRDHREREGRMWRQWPTPSLVFEVVLYQKITFLRKTIV